MSYLSAAMDVLESNNYRVSNIKPSEWAEKKRIMSSEVSPFPGPFNWERTPYGKEIIDCMMPEHPVRKLAIMKGAQIGISTIFIENAIGWIIEESPGPIFLLTAAAELSKQSMDVKVDQMIDSCGLRPLIRPNVLRARNQRTGDTSTSKEFPGGRLQTGVTDQHKKLRQVSMQYGFIDDFEAAKQSSKESGSTIDLIEQRFAAYYTKMKICYISTPEVKHTSNIEPLYEQGDQRRYFVPCPCCGSYIVLEWKVKNGNKVGGIIWDLDPKGKYIEGSTRYVCQECGESFDDSHKHQMNLAGEWRPTAKSDSPDFRSYHISALYAPVGMFDWEYYVKQYLRACPPEGAIKQDKYKAFRNLCLGLTWEERGETVNANRLSRNTRNYQVGHVPCQLSRDDANGEVVLITCAADLNGIPEDARLDYEIVAWTETQGNYSIAHGSIGTFLPVTLRDKEDTTRQKWTYEFDHPFSVWPKFLEVIEKVYPSDDGREMRINCTGIDSGHYTNSVYEFIMRYKDSLPHYITAIKGDKPDKYRRFEIDTPIFKQARERKDLFLLQVNQIKDELAVYIKMRWDERRGQDQPVGFMNFPTPKDGLYTMKSFFSHFESEHKTIEKDKEGNLQGARWVKRNSAVMNHFWDCRVYGYGLKELMAYQVCKEMGINKHDWNTFCKIVLN